MLTNKFNLNLAMQAWLINDEYDYVKDPNYISATSILKPVKQIILEKRLSADLDGDISNLIASKYGTSIHNGIEEAWTSDKLADNLLKLGLNQATVNRIKVNPTEPKEEDINVFLEQRSTKKIGNWTIGGKFDLVFDGQLMDNKSTSTWSYIYGSRIKDYTEQCSIYRWLNPNLITEPKFVINYIFTDWSQAKALQQSDYPQCRIVSKEYDLLPVAEVEHMLKTKLALVEKYMDADEKDIPECSDEELWRSPTKFKYYKDPLKLTRATKVFDSEETATSYWKLDMKGQGIVIPTLGSIKRCSYCKCFNQCTQKDRYLEDGSLQC